jgi:hypothetical protein
MSTNTPFASLSAVAAALLALTGCDVEEPDAAEIGFRTSVDNSEALNGIYLNGIYLNGIYLNGIYLNGIYLNSALLNGATVGGVDYVGGVDPKGEAVTCVRIEDERGKINVINAEGGCDVDPSKGEESKGDKAIDTELTFSGPEGEYRLYIDDAYEVKDYPHHYDHLHLYHYVLSYEIKGENGWTGVTSPLCQDGAGNPTEALLLPGEWDQTTGVRTDESDTTVTVACRHAALAKCVEWGYRPGLPSEKDHHQACVHMVRADYEGTGEAHTANGTTIYVSDALGINVEDDEPGLIKEAEWGTDGAVCVNRSAFRRADLTGCDDPSDPTTCFPGVPECGGSPDDLSLTAPGALLVTAVMGS